jgi:hypothetical protein
MGRSTPGAGLWFEPVWSASASSANKGVTIMGKLQGKVAVVTGGEVVLAG